MLSYYVEFHMRRALAPLLFADEELDEINSRRKAPVHPAEERLHSACALFPRRVLRRPFPAPEMQLIQKSLGGPDGRSRIVDLKKRYPPRITD